MEGSGVRRRLEVRIRAQSASLARVRRLLMRYLADQGVEVDQQHEALLVAHELVANAIEHGSTAEDEVEIAVTVDGRLIQIRILDPARTAASPAAQDPEEFSESGRGMLIVGRLANWTERLAEGRREVTAYVSLPL